MDRIDAMLADGRLVYVSGPVEVLDVKKDKLLVDAAGCIVWVKSSAVTIPR
jgi:hypothetical protein